MADPRGAHFSVEAKDKRGIVWLAACLAAEIVGCNRGTPLLHWERYGCIYLESGERLKHWTPPGAFGHYYRKKDIDQIAPAFKAAKENSHRPPEIIGKGKHEYYHVGKAEDYTDRPRQVLTRHARNKNETFYGKKHKYFLKTSLDALIAITERPTDPDRIFIEEAEELVGYTEQAIRRIEKSHKLNFDFGKETVLLPSGELFPRTTLSKKELLSIFIHRPDPGDPIVLPSGDPPSGGPWYLNDDAVAHYGFGKSFCYFWEKRDSIKTSGPALRKRWFYIIGESEARSAAWSGTDIDAIINGEEEATPRLAGISLFARKQRESRQKIARTLLRELRKCLPLRAKVALAAAKELGLTSKMIHALKDDLEIHTKVAKGQGRGKFWWCLASQTPPASGVAQTSATQLAAIVAKCRAVGAPPAEQAAKAASPFAEPASNGTVSATERNNGVPDVIGAPDEWRAYPDLEVEVNWKKRVVRNANTELEFIGCEAQWHILRAIWAAYLKGNAASIESIKDGYPGIYGKDTRRGVTKVLRKRLKELGVTIVRRRLVKIGK